MKMKQFKEIDKRKKSLPKKDGCYLVRMTNKSGKKYRYDFISYYEKRGWLTTWIVTHYFDVMNPKPGDQDPWYYTSAYEWN